MNRFVTFGLAAALVVMAGCTDDRTVASSTSAAPAATAAPATPGSYQVGGGLSKFYGEEVHENRLYVFGSKKTWEEFVKTKEMNPLNSRRLIGKGPMIGQGPQRMTMIVETTKDEPAKDKRILKTVSERYQLSL
jgi:hypothetical protein